MSRSRMLGVSLFLVIVSLLLGGSLAANGASSISAKTHATHYVSKLGQLSRDGSQDATIQSVLAGLDPEVITGAELGSPPSTDPNAGSWLYVTGQGSTSDGVALAEWEASLAQGAIADLLADGQSDLADVVGGASLAVSDAPTGQYGQGDLGAGDITAGQVFQAQAGDWTDSQIASNIGQALASFTDVSVSTHVVRPLGPAVEVTLTAQDMSSLNGKFEDVIDDIQGDGNYEGIYVLFELSDGTVVARASAAYRTGRGNIWFEPGYDEQLGIAHGAVPSGDPSD